MGYGDNGKENGNYRDLLQKSATTLKSLEVKLGTFLLPAMVLEPLLEPLRRARQRNCDPSPDVWEILKAQFSSSLHWDPRNPEPLETQNICTILAKP